MLLSGLLSTITASHTVEELTLCSGVRVQVRGWANIEQCNAHSMAMTSGIPGLPVGGGVGVGAGGGAGPPAKAGEPGGAPLPSGWGGA
jgi:hypothetical protein